MVSPERGLPDTFDPATGRNVKWSVELGTETHSTPVVAAGRVVIGTNNGNPRDPRHQGDRGVLMCFDERDGRFHWQVLTPKYSSDPYTDWPNSGLCSSPVIDGDRIYVMNNRVEILCLDLPGQANGNQGPFVDEATFMVPRGTGDIPLGPADGDVLWVFDVLTGAGTWPHDGAHAAILLDGPYLYLNTSNGVDNTHKRIRRPDGPSLIVLDKATGRLVARDDQRIGPRIFHSTWSSPALATVNGRRLVVFGGGDGVVYAFAALDPAAPAPPAHGTNDVARLKTVWQFDCDPGAPKEEVHRYHGNRGESPSNIKGMPVVHEQRVYVTVGGDLWWGKNEAWLKCIDATGHGDVTGTGQVWSYPLQRHSMSSPAIHDGLVYVGDSGGMVHCVDARTGTAAWTHDAAGEVWAAPLVADGKVYVPTRRGTVWIFAAARAKKVLAEVKLGSPISASPIAANGVLYVATMSRLYAVQAGASSIPPRPAARPAP
jgi:outer membrane protein assembly factor BamB